MSIADMAAKYEKKYGHQSAATGNFEREQEVVPSGILSLDLALGIGGWPKGFVSQVFGPPDIGKSSAIGIAAIREAQALGMNVGIVALEPGIDIHWLDKHGVDLEKLLILWPNDGQEAFEQLYDLVLDPEIGMVILDSIGQVQRPSEIDQKKGKPNQGGASALITWGIKRVVMPAWKLNKTVLVFNQIRDDMGAQIPFQYKPPGGHALEHSSAVIVQLRPGKERQTIKGDEGEDVLIGREIIAVVVRNKLAEGSRQRGKFWFYQKEVEGFPFGIATGEDVINTSMRMGVVTRGGANFYHSSFPEGKVRGRPETEEYIRTHDDVREQIRNEVMEGLRGDKGKQ